MSNTISYKKYFKYLKTISTIGTIYRFLFIYPFFLKYLGKKNIDYGCGIGQFLKYCKFFRKNILGLDINPYSIKYCKKNDLNCLLIKPVENVCKIVSENNDCVILDNVLEHIENPSKIIKDLKKIIRLKGYLIIGVPIGVAGFILTAANKIKLL
jgi:2-polyprenyl-3-methyl-5-hydroxy-6-metoxy-1,4-benzoquinol methylase